MDYWEKTIWQIVIVWDIIKENDFEKSEKKLRFEIFDFLIIFLCIINNYLYFSYKKLLFSTLI